MVSFSFLDGLEALCLVGTHSNLSHVDVTVGSLHQTKVFLRHALTGSGKLCDGADWSCLGSLTTRI